MFSKYLLQAFITQLIIYTVILISIEFVLSKRSKVIESIESEIRYPIGKDLRSQVYKSRIFVIIAIFTYISLLMFLQCMNPSIRFNKLYDLAIWLFVVVATLLFKIINEHSIVDWFLVVITLLSIALLHDPIEFKGYVTTIEREGEIAYIITKGHFNPSIEFHPIYKPFTFYIFNYYILMMMYSVSPWDLPRISFEVAIIVSYILILLAYARKLLKLINEESTPNLSPLTTLLCYLMPLYLIITPPMNVVRHESKWPSILLILIAMYVLLKSIRPASTILASIAIFAACFYHPTSMILMIFTMSAFLVMSIANLLNSIGIAKLHIHTMVSRSSIKKLTNMCAIALTIFSTTLLIRAVYTPEYINAILNALNQLKLVFKESINSQEIYYISPYQRSLGLSNAFVWSLVPALATATIITALLRIAMKRLILVSDIINISTYITGALFLASGFISGGNLSDPAYVGYIFMLVPSTTCIYKLFSTLHKSLTNKSLYTILQQLTIILITSSIIISITDPQVSEQSYIATGAMNIPATIEELHIAFLIASKYNSVSGNEFVILPYEIAQHMDYLISLHGNGEIKSKIHYAQSMREIIDYIKHGQIPYRGLYVITSTLCNNLYYVISKSSVRKEIEVVMNYPNVIMLIVHS